MEERFLLKCTRCLTTHEDSKISHIDTEGNIYCIRCASYLLKIGGYDLTKFNVEEFLSSY